MRRLYTIASAGLIDTAGGIYGPLSTPTQFEVNTIVNMVRRGIEVYEHNPANPAEKVRVTTRNVNSIVFKTTRADAVMRRALNMSLREETKEQEPITVDVERKSNNDKKKDKETKIFVVDTNQNTSEDKKEEPIKESVTKADAFAKN